MSKNIVESIIELSDKYKVPIILITSRRQIDSDDFGGGYVENCKTQNFANYVKKKSKTKNNEKVKDFVINGTAEFSEIYLLAKFLERNEHSLKWTPEDHWKVMKNNFCIFDPNYIDFVFFKENHFLGVQPNLYLEYRDNERNYKAIHESNFTHVDWIMINNLENDQLPWSSSMQELWINNNKNYFPPQFKCLKPGVVYE